MLTASRWRLVAWAAWDWGAASFYVVITSVVFAVYLTGTVAADETTGSATLGASTAIAGVVIAVIAPVWGQRSDASSAVSGRQRRLGALTAVVVLATAAMAVVRPQPSYLVLGLVLLAVATIAIELAMVEYNALLRRVASPGAIGRVSALGTAALSLGGTAVLLLSYIGFIAPKVGWFGVTHADGAGIRAVAVLCAVWFAVFAMPLLLTRMPGPVLTGPAGARCQRGWTTSYRQLWRHLVELRRHSPHLLGFLFASALFRDGLAALFVFLPVVAHGTFGLSGAELVVFATTTTVIGAAGAVAGGVFDDRTGPTAVIVGSLIGLVVTLAVLLFLDGHWAFWVCGLVLMVLAGPTLSASRSYLARIAPPGQEGELFGLYATTGRFASFLAPAAFAVGVSIFGGQRWGLLGITVVLLAGLLAVLPVRARDVAAEGGQAAVAGADRACRPVHSGER